MMVSFNLSLYNDLILSIKRGSTKFGKSNAKPLFLLSMIDCIFMRQLKENRILSNDKNMIRGYYALARYYNEIDIAPFIVPFYHTATSDFYHLIWKSDNRNSIAGKTPSCKYLRENLLYAKLDDELWDLLQYAENRDFLKLNIINRFLIK